jgi:hypothetical protein
MLMMYIGCLISTLKELFIPEIGNIQVEPTTFDQAWNHADPKDRDNWRITIKKVFIDMESKKILEIIKKEDIPEGKKNH